MFTRAGHTRKKCVLDAPAIDVVPSGTCIPLSGRCRVAPRDGQRVLCCVCSFLAGDGANRMDVYLSFLGFFFCLSFTASVVGKKLCRRMSFCECGCCPRVHYVFTHASVFEKHVYRFMSVERTAIMPWRHAGFFTPPRR